MEKELYLQNYDVKEERRNGIISCFTLSIAATAIIFAVFFGMLYYFNVFPFSENCVSQYDLLAQIVPFAEHFFDVIKGEASFFYSYRVGGGMDVFGTVMYCLCSPFSFLFFFFGEGNVYYAASVMLPVKFSCIAIAAIIMIKVRFKDMHDLIALPVALLYAFCGYTFVANTYINWMDFLIYMPFAVLAFEHMRKTGKIRWLALVIAACIYSCFSIACFSMLISYPLFVVYGFLVVKKEDRKNYLFKISLCYLCGVLAALPVMAPALIAYLKSGRNTGIFDSLWNDIDGISYYRKFSYILSDALFVILIAVYFIQTQFKTKQSRFLGVAGLMIMMPVLVDECCILMNMGSYMSYALRFGFLNAIYELFVSCLVLEKVSFKRKTCFENNLETARRITSAANIARAVQPFSNENEPKESAADRFEREEKAKRKIVLGQWIMFILLAALAVFLCVVIYEIFCVVRNIEGLDLSFWPALEELVEDAKELSQDFSASFAHSTGGLQGIAILFGVIALIAVPCILLYRLRVLNLKFIYPCLALVIFTQVCFYGSQLVCGNIFNPVRYDQYNSLYQTVLEREDDPEYYYRVKDFNGALSDNQGFITNSNSYTVFSSVTDQTNFAPNEVFGFDGNGVNTIKGAWGTLLGNSLMGNKYYFFQTEDGATLDYEYVEKIAQEEYFAIYENKLVFPSAYTVSSGNMGVVTDYDQYFNNMQNLYEFLGGEGEVFTTYSIPNYEMNYVSVSVDEASGKSINAIHVKVRLNESGDFSFYSELPTDKGIKWYTSEYVYSKDITSVKTYTYHNKDTSSYYSMYLYTENDDYNLTLEEIQKHCSIKVITTETVEKLAQSLWERVCDYTIENTFFNTSYKASVTTDKEGEYLFLNYMNIEGMKAYVNGREVPLVKNGLNMLLVPLDKGANDVQIVYTSPYPTYSLVAALFSVCALFVVWLIVRNKKAVKVLEKPVAFLSVALASAVVIAFMAFPTTVFFTKVIRLLVEFFIKIIRLVI